MRNPLIMFSCYPNWLDAGGIVPPPRHQFAAGAKGDTPAPIHHQRQRLMHPRLTDEIRRIPFAFEVVLQRPRYFTRIDI